MSSQSMNGRAEAFAPDEAMAAALVRPRVLEGGLPLAGSAPDIRLGAWLWAHRRSVGFLAGSLILWRSAGFLFGIVNIDESDFALIARMMRSGALPYVGAIDNKPLFTYLAFLPGAWSSAGLLPMRILGVLWVLATCLVLRRAAQRWTSDVEVGWMAAWCAGLAGLCELPSVSAELLMNLPAALALGAFIRCRKEGTVRWALVTGLWVAVASLFKQQAGILLPALALGLLWPVRGPTRPARLPALSLLVLGFVLPWAAVFAVYGALGHAGALVEWVFQEGVSYISRVTDPPWGRMAGSMLVCVVTATPLLWVFAVRESFRKLDPIRVGLLAALWLSWIPVCLGGRFYEHYFLQFAPALALLAAPAAAALSRRWAWLPKVRRAAVLFALVAPPVGYLGYSLGRGALGQYPGQEPRARAIAAWLKGHTAPDDTVFVWGHYSPVYLLSDRAPGTRYITASMHMGNFDPSNLPAGFDVRPYQSQAEVDRTLEDLEARHTRWVVDTAPADLHNWSRVPLAGFPRLAAYVATHYEQVAAPAGAIVYRRVR